MARQRTPAGVTVGFQLSNQVPPDAVPMGDGRHLYSQSTRRVLNWEACVQDDIPQPGPPAPPQPAAPSASQPAPE